MKYIDRIQSIADFSMDKIIQNCLAHVPDVHKRSPWCHPELNHGLDLLCSEEVLDYYIAAYGEMHQAKCKAAIQNIPFHDLNGVFEIVDWGCGQGVGSLCLLDAIKDRELLYLLKRVTLVEPSEAALSRAVQNVKQSVRNSIVIQDINRYLPAEEAPNPLEGVDYICKNVIHIFSNILDVLSIDLVSLAKMVTVSGHNHYILCIGPLNGASFRIDQFAQILNADNLFSNISDSRYGLTSRTLHNYTCKSKCFKYNGSPLNYSTYRKPTGTTKVYGEYDINLSISNNLLSYDEAWVYYRLESILSYDDIICVKPTINGTTPDFIILRPNKGIVIVDVCECDVTQYKPNNQKDKKEEKDAKYNTPVELMQAEHEAIKTCVDKLLEKIIADTKNISLMKKVIVCTKNTMLEVRETLKDIDKYITFYGSEFIPDEKVCQCFFHEIHANYTSNTFDSEIFKELASILSPSWHSYREGVPVHLTKAQEKLVVSKANAEQKISGVAGSGKTQVLATRAINAQLRTGGDVLILTFNTTLANYIKYRLAQIRADFSWNKITISPYHHFFRTEANRCNLKIHTSFDDQGDLIETSYENPLFFKDAETKRFDAIFIDEVQDYTTDWLKLIRDAFLKPNGEFAVFGDPKQNIYNRPTSEKTGDLLLGIIGGEWNKSLKEGKRFNNPRLVEIATQFQNTFFKLPNDEISNVFFAEIQYNLTDYYETDIETAHILEIILCICKKNNIQDKDVCILASTTKLLRDIDFLYRQTTGKDTVCAFSRQEVVDKIRLKNTSNPYGKKQDLENTEMARKKSFSIVPKCFKLSTIQSFKGWESQTIFLILQQNSKDIDFREKKMGSFVSDSPELIYTAITRATENLIVINTGNNCYHDFFLRVLNQK